MIQFNKPINLNGAELLAELNDAGIDVTNSPFIDENGNFWLDIKPQDETAAKAIVAAHNGNTTPKESTIQDKLVSVGLNLEDLKTALGL